ncbi:MAG: 50S ribosomal protein L15 [bacterium]|nr:50S ribosomal protein L15 [bacterium]
MKLHELPADPGKTQKKRRVGRGEGSGWGRTAGKGNKGKKSRSGAPKGAGFEGGQMPMIRRLPKFGFSNDRYRLKRAEISLGQLEKSFEEGATVDFAALTEKRLVSKQAEYVKVLANGAVTKKLAVKLHGFSAKARQAIESAGGTCETV